MSIETIAYIDAANLYKGTSSLGWKLDYRKFRHWIKQKFNVSEAFFFIGLMPKNANLYTLLQKLGYLLVFKEVIYDSAGKAKGNCDADLVLQAAKDVYTRNIKSTILVASDGDYAPLVKFWKENNIRYSIISPAKIEKCSILLKRTNAPIVCLEDMRHKLQIDPK